MTREPEYSAHQQLPSCGTACRRRGRGGDRRRNPDSGGSHTRFFPYFSLFEEKKLNFFQKKSIFMENLGK